jgi:hypothetical protein
MLVWSGHSCPLALSPLPASRQECPLHTSLAFHKLTHQYRAAVYVEDFAGDEAGVFGA